DLRPGEFPVAFGQQLFVVEPSGPAAFEGDEVLDARHAIADAIHDVQEIDVHAQSFAAAVSDNVHEVIGREAEIHRHDHGPELWNPIKLLELLMRVARNGPDP